MFSNRVAVAKAADHLLGAKGDGAVVDAPGTDEVSPASVVCVRGCVINTLREMSISCMPSSLFALPILLLASQWIPFMREAIAESVAAEKEGNHPFGAVLVSGSGEDMEIIARG